VGDAAGGAVKMQQPRRAAFGGWFLSDELVWEVEVERADVHASMLVPD
jgi:hypothetical protein